MTLGNMRELGHTRDDARFKDTPPAAPMILGKGHSQSFYQFDNSVGYFANSDSYSRNDDGHDSYLNCRVVHGGFVLPAAGRLTLRRQPQRTQLGRLGTLGLLTGKVLIHRALTRLYGPRLRGRFFVVGHEGFPPFGTLVFPIPGREEGQAGDWP